MWVGVLAAGAAAAFTFDAEFARWPDHPGVPALTTMFLACKPDGAALSCVEKVQVYDEPRSWPPTWRYEPRRLPAVEGASVVWLGQRYKEVLALDSLGRLWLSPVADPKWTRMEGVPDGITAVGNDADVVCGLVSTSLWCRVAGEVERFDVGPVVEVSMSGTDAAFRTTDGRVGSLRFPYSGRTLAWHDGLKGATDVAVVLGTVCGIVGGDLRCAEHAAPSVPVPFAGGALYGPTGPVAAPKVLSIGTRGVAMLALAATGEVVAWRPGDPSGELLGAGMVRAVGESALWCVVDGGGAWWC